MAELNSLISSLRSYPKATRIQTITDAINSLSDNEIASLIYDWEFWARPNQLPPADVDWFVWFIQAGRGFGKTRTGAEWVRDLAFNGKSRHISLVGPTIGDVRELMIEGESGLMNVAHPKWRPVYEPTKHKLTWPNGVICMTYTADEPDRIRGHNSYKAWCDEVGSWRYEQAWSNLLFGMRRGLNPQIVVTTTPKPTKLIRSILARPSTYITKASSYENRANLSEVFIREVLEPYEGTDVGRQEIYADILDDKQTALWKREWIDNNRVRISDVPDLSSLVIAIDPAVTANKKSDETGMIAAGKGEDGRGYLLEDLSGHYSPGTWAEIAVSRYHALNADAIIGETNNGGDLIESNIRSIDRSVRYVGVHASRGKYPRAEPVAGQSQINKIKHVGVFADLEYQLCNYDGSDDIPTDRLDAYVWAMTRLLLGNKQVLRAS